MSHFFLRFNWRQLLDPYIGLQVKIVLRGRQGYLLVADSQCTNNYEEAGINLSLTTVQAILEKIKTQATVNLTDTVLLVSLLLLSAAFNSFISLFKTSQWWSCWERCFCSTVTTGVLNGNLLAQRCTAKARRAWLLSQMSSAAVLDQVCIQLLKRMFLLIKGDSVIECYAFNLTETAPYLFL